MKLGVISDTHGHLPPAVHAIFQDVDRIFHAGDIGQEDILLELETIAPVLAVRGNMDKTGAPATFRNHLIAGIGTQRVLLVHDLGSPNAVKSSLRPLIQEHQPTIVIFGHTHQPFIEQVGSVLYFNPGSASRGRGGSGNSVGIIETNSAHATGRIIPI